MRVQCPNPGCKHGFAPEAGKRDGGLYCPKCGKKIMLTVKPKAPVAKPAGLPVWLEKAVPEKKSPPPPTPKIAANDPVPEPPVTFTPIRESPPAPTEKLIRVHSFTAPRSRHPVLKWLIVASLIAVFLGGAAYIVHLMQPGLLPGTSAAQTGGLIYMIRNKRGEDERAFTLRVDRDSWNANKELRTRLKAIAAFSHKEDNGEVWFAIAVEDYGQRLPRQGELLDGAFDRMRRQFGDTFQYDAKEIAEVKTLGVDSLRFPFKGTAGGEIWEGECRLIAKDGLAYWILVAGPSRDDARAVYDHLEEEKTIELTTERRDWTEQTPAPDVFLSRSGGLSMTLPKGVWQKFDPTTADENGDLFLSGQFPREQGNAKSANLLAIALPRNDDPREAYKTAISYLEKKKQEESNEYRFDPVRDEGAWNGDVMDRGDQKFVVGEIRVMRNTDPMRYVVLAVVGDDAKTYALRFECAWAHRAIWRQDFLDLIKAVRVGK